MALIQFVRNHSDHSTERGFQFEFHCDRCGNGYQTEFMEAPGNLLNDALGAAGSLFGGLFNSAADVSHRARSATWEKARDDAFKRAVELARPNFHKCKRCGKWVDADCWNPERGLCKDDAPDLETEYSVAQTQAAIEQAQTKAREVDYVTADKFKQTIRATCSNCGADVKGAKFCPECGTPVQRSTKCGNCGAETNGAKFCPECGTKQ